MQRTALLLGRGIAALIFGRGIAALIFGRGIAALIFGRGIAAPLLAPLFLFTACAGFEMQQDAYDRAPSNASPFGGHFDDLCVHGFAPTLGVGQDKLLGQHMAPRDHRLWHNFWHSTRNSWHKLTAEQRDFFLRLDPRWEPPRLLGAPPGVAASDKYDPRKNNAGEDFFFMHHTMMSELYASFGAAGLACPEPWLTLPDKNDKTWPIEPSKDGKDEKSDTAYAQLDAWRQQFQSAKYLKARTLGDIGYLLETTLHNNMHMRWATYDPPQGFGDRPDITPETLAHGLEAFDAPGYDWLADSYSAHVNPTFWKLHGLVENVLFSWLTANGYSEVAESCAGRHGCYQWKGTWVGASPEPVRGMPMPGGPHNGHDGMGSGEVFADRFSRAYDDFVEGRDSAEADPKGPMRASPPPSPAEKARRKRLLDDALRILGRNSGMDRGALRGEWLDRVKQNGPVSAEEYVKWVDSEE